MERAFSAKTEVLIHDLKMRLETWSPVWELLREDGHQIIAADLPGRGGGGMTASHGKRGGMLLMKSVCV